MISDFQGLGGTWKVIPMGKGFLLGVMKIFQDFSSNCVTRLKNKQTPLTLYALKG